MCIICADLSGQLSRKAFVVDDFDPRLVDRFNVNDSGLSYLDVDERGGVSPTGRPSLLPWDAGAQITRSNSRWGTNIGDPATVTYAFRSTAPGTMPSDTTGFSRFTDTQIVATELTLLAWADVARVTFVRQGTGTSGEGAYSDNATMLFSNYSSGQSGAAAFAYLAGNTSVTSNSGDVWVNSSLAYNSAPAYLAYGYQVLLHEVGHALGLSHPADYNAGSGGAITYTDSAQYYEDTRQYTVMSYFSEGFTGAAFAGRYASAPLLDDIAAAQRLYGANMTTRTGDTVYGFNSTADRIWYDANQGGGTQAVIFSVWDAGGTDTLDFSGYNHADSGYNGSVPAARAVIDLRQGHFSNVGGLVGNVSIAVGAQIENAIGGAGVETIIGNGSENTLRGNGGDDTIDGGTGFDVAVFSGNREQYTITVATELVNGVSYHVLIVSGPDGTDRLYNIEQLQFANGTINAPTGVAGIRLEGDLNMNTLPGTIYADNLFGAGGNDILLGDAGDDLLAGGRGSDSIDGGAGIDTADYSMASGFVEVNLATGQAVESAAAGGGTDTLTAIENVRGSRYNDVITGDAQANRLEGGGGIDTLNGGGGSDVLVAGAGVAASDAAPDVTKAAGVANVARTSAVNIDGNFDLINDAGVVNASTVPHAVVNATANGGGQEYYAFTVTAGARGVFDITTASFDTTLELYDSAGNLVASNDDIRSGDTTSYLSYTFNTAGTYYIAVGLWSSNSGNTFTSISPTAGATYGLNVSIDGHSVPNPRTEGSSLNGEDGDDTLYSGNGNDTLNGGAGSDTVVYSGARSAYTITDQGGGTYRVTGPDGTGTDTLIGIERIQFSDLGVVLTGGAATVGDDVLTGTSGNDSIDGLAGNDTIDGLGGDDRLYGNSGNDTLYGRDGNDFLFGGAGNDRLEGGNGNDWLVAGTGTDTLVGGLGDDLYSVDDISTVVIEDADGGLDTVATSLNYTLPTNVEVVRLFGGADRLMDAYGNAQDNGLMGSAGGNYLSAGAGNDWLDGQGGDDFLVGGDGNDYLRGAEGRDRLQGGAGNDIYLIEDIFDTIEEEAGGGTDLVYSYVNVVLSENIEQLRLLGPGLIDGYGNNGDNIIIGSEGANYLNGGGGADWLSGELGNDYIEGGDGNDGIVGGFGADRLFGNAGADTFYYYAASDSTAARTDVIGDFEVGLDKIYLASIRQGSSDLFTLTVSGNNTLISVDLGGDGVQDMLIRVDGVVNLSTNDIVWGSAASASGVARESAHGAPRAFEKDATTSPLVLPGLDGKGSDSGPLVLPAMTGDVVDTAWTFSPQAAVKSGDGRLVLPGLEDTGLPGQADVDNGTPVFVAPDEQNELGFWGGHHIGDRLWLDINFCPTDQSPVDWII